ncbi:hypothetical protein ACHAWO_002655 [Cyclotella atomus]|uniref:Uncharacterized protein n=1 Tax=Cyclotella atomus TaxID=382360 RepID=A0ABD3Q576_9STRA
MDNIQSWSSFEQQQRSRPSSTLKSSTDNTPNKDIHALYVSPSSTNIAQSAASLLRQAGLSGENDEEFKLKFHWMRPHPSLIFEIQDELMHSNETEGSADLQQHDDVNVDPAIEASRLMKGYRFAQLEDMDETDKGTEDTSMHKAISNTSMQSEKIENETEEKEGTRPSLNLPIEMPRLRINLANLVEPPLMTTWLPGEDEVESEQQLLDD